MPDEPQPGMLSGWKSNVANIGAIGLINLCFYAMVQHSMSAADADRALLKEQLESSQKQVTNLSNQLWWAHKETVDSLKEVVARQKKTTMTLENVEKKVDAPK